MLIRSIVRSLTLALTVSSACLAQQWEVGGAGGFGWYVSPSIRNAIGSADAGFPAKGAIGAVFGENMYEYLGGEVRYLFRFGGPQLRFGGTQVNMTGHTNVVVYDFLVHMRSRDSKVRPFVAGGAGIKVYSGTGFRSLTQPLGGFALLSPVNQVEPAISVGGGLKYLVAKHILLRADFRTYMTPLPDRIFRPTGFSAIHGWVFDFVPLAGISYVF
jgi:hypothetical protein